MLARSLCFLKNTFDIDDILHSDVSSIWGVKVLETTWHTDQHPIHAVTSETLHTMHT